MNPTREQAWNLLTEHTHSTTLLKHALAVEAAMRAYAVYFGEDPELWAVTGLVHDLDYEQHPTANEHPLVGAVSYTHLDVYKRQRLCYARAVLTEGCLSRRANSSWW